MDADRVEGVTARAWRRLGPHWRSLAAIAGIIMAVLVAVGVALEVTPMQTVAVAGQVIKVGAAPRFSLRGPGEVDLFGERLPTAVSFPGPIRPALQLSHITLDSELTNFVQGTSATRATRLLRSRLISGFEHYVAWEDAAATAIALLLAGAVAGWRRLPIGATARLLALTLSVTQVVNLGAAAVTAHGAEHALRSVHSLSQLVGSRPVPPPAPARRTGPLVTGVQEVVIGDSTAAGAGLPRVAGATATDKACGRSQDAYAVDLARVNGWRAVNLACDSATIQAGLLGPQEQGGRQIPAQVAAAARIKDPAVLIVSVGADDLHWSAILQICAVSRQCDNQASAAYFEQALATFSTDYLQLLIRLGTLPGRPRVIINGYYDPFGADLSCVTRQGLTAAKVRTLGTWLAALNKVLAAGASQFGFASAQPSFAGHQLCSAEPYVQDLTAKAPFHPTALGQAAIALADQRALSQQPARAPAPASSRPSPP
jgi:lysophospholipase L1-like esterase